MATRTIGDDWIEYGDAAGSICAEMTKSGRVRVSWTRRPPKLTAAQIETLSKWICTHVLDGKPKGTLGSVIAALHSRCLEV